MTYYMKPPRGNIALHTLQKCVLQRFQFLVSLENCEMTVPKNFEYLNDGTSMDRVGHYVLRLISLSSHSFKKFVLKAETQLFVNRFDVLNHNQIINVLKILYKHAQEIMKLLPEKSKEFNEFLLTVKHVCKNIIQPDMAVHTFNKTHSESCCFYNIHVPFRMCLPLVQKREVELKAGKCIVPCGKWKALLRILFQLHLEFGMKHLQTSGCLHQALHDFRIHQLAQDLGRRFGNDSIQVTRQSLAAYEVDVQSAYFPPCMAHLYQTLKTKHRLTHEARRQFTLFLKDAGMPIEEALNFWSVEYSRPRLGCDTKCTHSWQKDGHRYRYSIRHMYGLEGGRYRYKMLSCRSLQRTHLTPLAEGGCPFHHFDNTRMMSSFSSEVLDDESTMNKILHLKAIGQPLEACHLYLAVQRNIYTRNADISDQPSSDVSNSLISFTDPVQYYFCQKSWKNINCANDKHK